MTKRRTLTEELEHLERTDPDVAAAKKRLDETWWRLLQPEGSYFRRPKRSLTPQGGSSREESPGSS